MRAPVRLNPAWAVAAMLLLAGCGRKQEPPPPTPTVGVVKLAPETVMLTTELPGRVAAVETSDVRPQISGVIRQRLFEQGGLVRKGQLLFVIEDAPYRAAALQARGQLARAQAAIASTRLQAQRYRELVGINAVSRQEADNATASAGQARADVSAGRGALQSAVGNLGFTRIRAPISGRIGRSLFTPGALVQAGQADALATIQRTDSVYVDLTQSASEITDLRQALMGGAVSRAGPQVARVRLVLPNGAAYPVEGRLDFSEVTVDQTTGAVTLRATFGNPGGLLLPGMFVRARIVEGVRAQAIMVPQSGVSRNERGEATALVVGAGDKVEQRIITTDRAEGDRWIVASGLKAGDRLIVEGLAQARPGVKVKPMTPALVGASAKPRPGAPLYGE